MLKRSLALNMIILTISGIIAKTIDFSFRSYYSMRLGEEGMGIFSLIMSAYGIILSLSSAGIGVAVSRLVSQKEARGEFPSMKKVVSTAVSMVASSGLICVAVIAVFADRIALSFLHDIRCTHGLLSIAPATIFMGVSYCLKGYFYATREVVIPASSEFVEQAVKLAAISFFLEKGLAKGVEYGCAGVLMGLCVGELCSCLYLCFWYKIKARGKASGESQTLPILRMTLPMTISAVGSSFLRMTEDLWIVRGFRKYGMEMDKALGTYGLIHGMAMPLLVFPLTLISSFMAFLVPEIAKAEEKGALSRTVGRVWEIALFCGGLIFSVFFIYAEEISLAVYGSVAAAEYIKPLSVLCPVMIIDSLSNGMLGGLGEQMNLLKHSLLDSALRLTIIYFALPLGGNFVIIAMIFLSNIMTCALTAGEIKKKSKIVFGWRRATAPFLSALLTIFAVGLFRPSELSGVYLVGFIVLTAGIYSIIYIKQGHLPKGRCPKVRVFKV